MPARALRPCSQPGCQALGKGRYCEKHQRDNADRMRRQVYDRARERDPRYQTPAWQRTRKFILARDPLCKIAVVCTRRYGSPAPSVEVDHVTPVNAGGDFWDPANLQGACHADHSRKTATEDSGFARG